MEFFSLIFSLFGDFIEFLDNFKLFGSLSILRIIVILFIFKIALNFLLKNKRGD